MAHHKKPLVLFSTGGLFSVPKRTVYGAENPFNTVKYCTFMVL